MGVTYSEGAASAHKKRGRRGPFSENMQSRSRTHRQRRDTTSTGQRKEDSIVNRLPISPHCDVLRNVYKGEAIEPTRQQQHKSHSAGRGAHPLAD